MGKRWIGVAAGLILSLSSITTAMAEEGTWEQDSTGWRYQYEDGTGPKNSWQEIRGSRFYFDRDGYMAAGWHKIGGYYYCFQETGEQVTGWSYHSEEDKWYYYTPDGTLQKGWFQDQDGSWYWFTNRGEMINSGYRSIGGKRYYFYENGRMAANQYVGTYYMDENGHHDKEHDIVIEGKKKISIQSEEKDQITEALKDIPGAWIKYFVDNGWEFLYYPDKSYFSAPESGGNISYIYHKLDSSYRKIKFCKVEALTQAFGEYMGYISGIDKDGSAFMLSLSTNQGNVDQFVEVPDYYLDDMRFYFGKLVEAYLDEEKTELMEADSPEVCKILLEVLNSPEN